MFPSNHLPIVVPTSPWVDIEISYRTSDLWFGHHSRYPGILGRFLPERPTYFRSSKFGMSRASRVYPSPLVILPNNKIRRPPYHVVWCVLLHITDIYTCKIGASPFLSSFPDNCRRKFHRASSRLLLPILPVIHWTTRRSSSSIRAYLGSRSGSIFDFPLRGPCYAQITSRRYSWRFPIRLDDVPPLLCTLSVPTSPFLTVFALLGLARR